MANYQRKFQFTTGDTDAIERYTLKRGGSAIDLAGYTGVKLYALRRDDDTTLSAIVGSIVTPGSGLVQFDHTTIAATRGTYLCQIETTNGSSKVRRSPYFQIDVVDKVET